MLPPQLKVFNLNSKIKLYRKTLLEINKHNLHAFASFPFSQLPDKTLRRKMSRLRLRISGRLLQFSQLYSRLKHAEL